MTSTLKSKSWAMKYKPADLSQYIFQNDNHKKQIDALISGNMSGHVLLSGIQGTGKTSLSDILLCELNVDPSDVLRINASDETSIDVIRNKVVNFISAVPNGDFRVVQMEEADYLSPNGQAALRGILEEYIDTAKFIFTCNYVHKIIPALKSRCLYQLEFKSPDKTNVLRRIIEILLAEKIKFDPNTIEKYVNICYPDLRKIIQTVQQHCTNNELLDPSDSESNDDYKFKFLELLEKDDWEIIRNLICKQVSNDEIDSVYRFLYDNLNKSPKFKSKDKWETGIVYIAEYLYKDSLASDREIILTALFIELGRI